MRDCCVSDVNMAVALNFFLRILCSLSFLVTWSAAILDRTTREAIDHVIETGMGCREIPGLSLAIVKDGQVLYSRGYGVKDLDSRQPVTSDTQFQLASLSKAFTATLLTHVVAGDSSKKISTNVYRTMPESFKFNNTLRSVYATMEDLLAHRMGIPRNNYVRLRTDYNIHTFASKLRYLPHKGGFRDSFYYNDLMYGLSAHITERLGQGTWKQQMREAIYQPIGMTNSTFVDDVDFNTADIAQPYVRYSGRIVKASIDFVKHWGKNYGSGNLVSTASDMAHWMMALLRDGRDRRGRRVLREGVARRTFVPQNVIYPYKYVMDNVRSVTPEPFTADNYGLGWMLGLYRGVRLVHHSGTSTGYRAFLSLLPSSDVGVVTLMTGSDTGFKLRLAMHTYLLDTVLGHAPWLNSSTICPFVSSRWRRSVPRKRRSSNSQGGDLVNAESLVEEGEDEEHEDTPMYGPRTRRSTCGSSRARRTFLSLRNYAGRFYNPAYGALTVRYHAGNGSLTLRYGIGLWRLERACTSHEFTGRWILAPPTLTKNFKFMVRRSRVYGLQAIGFEPAKPPVFYK